MHQLIEQLCATHFQDGNRLLESDGRKTVEELFQRFSSLEVIEQRLDRNARTGETRAPLSRSGFTQIIPKSG